ncbi:MAG TPA: hypothetical protein VGB95_04655 [Chitinophagales bacterium]
MNKKFTSHSLLENTLSKMQHSLFDEEIATLFQNEKLLQPSKTSLKIISEYSKKTAKKPNLLLC